MNILSKKISPKLLFIVFGGFVSFLAWCLIGLVEMQLFNKPILLALSVVLLVIAGIILLRTSFKKLDRSGILAVLIIILFALSSVYFAHEPYSGGRDNGVYANFAAYISQHGTYCIEGELPLSFPGFTRLENGCVGSGFFFGYPAWLAYHVSLFGIIGVTYANFLLLFVGLTSFFIICRRLLGSKTALFLLLLLITTYPMLWFTRDTYSENLTFMLIWYGLLCLLEALEKKNKYYLFPVIAAFGVLLVTRVESFIIIPMFLFVLIYYRFVKQERWINIPFITIILILFFLPAIYYNLILNNKYFIDFINVIKNFSVNYFSKGIASSTSSSQISLTAMNANKLEYNIPILTAHLLNLFNLFFYVLFVPLSLIMVFKNHKDKIATKLVVMFFVLLPQFYYLLNLSINPDSPWFLRRFFPVIIPLSILSFGYIINNMSSVKKSFLLFVSIAFSCIFINIVLASKIVTFKEYDNALNQIQSIDRANINQSDALILVDYENLGHYKIPEPLYFVFDYNVVAVTRQTLQNYLQGINVKVENLYGNSYFNVPDICNYRDIYVLTNSDVRVGLQTLFSTNEVSVRLNIPLHYRELARTCELFRLTKNKNTAEAAHIPIDEALKYCSDIPSAIVPTDLTLQLLQIQEPLVNILKSNACNQ